MPLLSPGNTLGRYTILGKMATGGMSEVYLARHGGPSGFSKVLVLKIILPQLADDPQFVQMFHNEAKLAGLLNHSNIVQIFDFGLEGGVHFMALEYIDGRNLTRILRTLATVELSLPPSVALRVVSDAAGALEYAHGLADGAGRPLQIVHRDVSLENILVTYTGQVKIVDFGIAKARTLESYTGHGTLKGKYSYMAPETITGLSVDHRIDIYALGVVLYRLLLGQMPFVADNHAQLLNRIVNEPPPPPRQLVRDLSPELERVLLRVLEKDRNRRYQRAAELQADLERYLQDHGTVVTPYHLQQFMSEVFPPGSDEDRETFQQLAGTSTPFTPSQPGRSPLGLQPPPPLPRGAGTNPTWVRGRPPSAERESRSPALPGPAPEPVTAEDDGGAYQDAAETEIYTGPRLSQSLSSASAALETLRASRGAPTEAESPGGSPDLARALGPEPAAWAVDPPRTWVRMAVMLVSGVSILGLAGGLYLLFDPAVPPAPPPADVGPRADGDSVLADLARRPPDRGALSKDAASTRDGRPVTRPKGFLSVRAPAPAEVLINGRPVGGVPLSRAEVRPGSYTLQVRSATMGYAITRAIDLQPGGHLDVRLTPRKGTLRILVRPWATVVLDGKPLGTTPLAPASLYEGPHRLELTNDKLRARKVVQIQVRPGREEVVKVRLE
jgi:serine/threonine-protein kinase